MAWIDVSSDEIPTAGDHAAKVAVSKGASSTLLFAKSGAKEVYQREEETVTEYRGLTEASAQAKAGVTDGTTQTAWYGTFGSEDHSIVATTGTRTVATAARANEARGWTLTVRETTYSTIPEDLTEAGWAKTLAGDTGETGRTRTVSNAKSLSHLQTWSGCALFQTKETIVEETTGLKDEATAKAKIDEAVASSSFKLQKYVCSVECYGTWNSADGTKSWQSGSWCWTMGQTGTLYYGSSRKVSDAEGWAVTITKEVYDAIQTGNGEYTPADSSVYPYRVSWSKST